MDSAVSLEPRFVETDSIRFSSLAVGASTGIVTAVSLDGRLISLGTHSGGLSVGAQGTVGQVVIPLVDRAVGVAVSDVRDTPPTFACWTSQGKVYIWGQAKGGQLGQAGVDESEVPRLVQTPESAGPVQQVCLGDAFVLARTSKGQVLQWGCGSLTPTAMVFKARHSIPMFRSGSSEISDAGAGSVHAIAATVDGSVFVWLPGTTGSPILIPGLARFWIVRVKARLESSVLLARDGSAFVLDHRNHADQPAARRVPWLTRVQDVFIGPGNVMFFSSSIMIPATQAMVLANGQGWTGAVTLDAEGPVIGDNTTEKQLAPPSLLTLSARAVLRAADIEAIPVLVRMLNENFSLPWLARACLELLLLNLGSIAGLTAAARLDEHELGNLELIAEQLWARRKPPHAAMDAVTEVGTARESSRDKRAAASPPLGDTKRGGAKAHPKSSPLGVIPSNLSPKLSPRATLEGVSSDAKSTARAMPSPSVSAAVSPWHVPHAASEKLSPALPPSAWPAINDALASPGNREPRPAGAATSPPARALPPPSSTKRDRPLPSTAEAVEFSGSHAQVSLGSLLRRGTNSPQLHATWAATASPHPSPLVLSAASMRQPAGPAISLLEIMEADNAAARNRAKIVPSESPWLQSQPPPKTSLASVLEDEERRRQEDARLRDEEEALLQLALRLSAEDFQNQRANGATHRRKKDARNCPDSLHPPRAHQHGRKTSKK